MSVEEVLIPVRDLMLVRREPGNDSEYHGIVLPESARKHDHIRGTILSVGPKSIYDAGLSVVMSRGAGTALGLLAGDKEELAIISPMDVLALLPEGEVAA